VFVRSVELVRVRQTGSRGSGETRGVPVRKPQRVRVRHEAKRSGAKSGVVQQRGSGGGGGEQTTTEYHAEMEVKKATAELLKRKRADASAAGAASTCAACAATTHVSKASFLCPLHPKNVWKCLCVSWAQCKCGKKQAALAAERAAYAAKHARPVPATTTNPNPFAMKKEARKAAVARMGANDTE
jgi:hypothetical protein